jgi:hypothetical protein
MEKRAEVKTIGLLSDLSSLKHEPSLLNRILVDATRSIEGFQ